MKDLKIALLQLMPGADAEENLRIGQEACRTAKQMGADIALFPEMWNCGYTIPEQEQQLRGLAVSAQGAFVRAFARLAAELEMAIGITFLEAYEPLPRNSLCLLDRHGKQVLHYAKVHTCDFGDECRLSRGDGFSVAHLDLGEDTVCVGAMICYDREFPESARVLMLQGAELILTPNACPMEINRLSQLRGRAYENMLAIATCNYPTGKPDCNGHSSLFDGVAYLPELSGSRDSCVLEAGGEPGIYLAVLELEQLRTYRSQEVHGNAYRRPEHYGSLIQPTIRAPFVRTDRKA